MAKPNVICEPIWQRAMNPSSVSVKLTRTVSLSKVLPELAPSDDCKKMGPLQPAHLVPLVASAMAGESYDHWTPLATAWAPADPIERWSGIASALLTVAANNGTLPADATGCRHLPGAGNVQQKQWDDILRLCRRGIQVPGNSPVRLHLQALLNWMRRQG